MSIAVANDPVNGRDLTGTESVVKAGNRTRVTWPDALYVDYTYDALNRMKELRENGATVAPGLLATYSYDNLGRRAGLTRGNAVTTSWGYDGASRLASLTQNPAGTTYDQTYGYSYTPASGIASRSASNDTYAYAGFSVGSTNYGAANGLNQYPTVGVAAFGYDNRANLTSDGVRTMTYDVENRLISVNGGGASLDVAYDPLGRLGETSSTGAVMQFLYAGDALVAEYNCAGTLLRRDAHGAGVDEPLVWYEGSTTTDRRWLLGYERGSIIAETDGAGAASIYAYDAFGIPKNDIWTGSRFRYTGQIVLDAPAKLYHYKARVYDPKIGRFFQTDPIGYEDQLNLYAYVGNDPVNRTDPTGTYGRGDGFTDDQWKKFDKFQQDAAKAMDRRAYKLDAKADKMDAKGKASGDQLRERAGALRAGSGFLKSDGSDGAKANMVSASDWKGNPEAAARVDRIGGNQMFVNGGHSAWKPGSTDSRVTFIVGHESLHSAGYRHALGPGNIPSYRYGDQAQKKVYRSITGTPAANRDPDHLMSEVYP